MGGGSGRGLDFGNVHGSDVYPGDVDFMSTNDAFSRFIRKRADVDLDGRFDVIAHGNESGIAIQMGDGWIMITSRIAARLFKSRGLKRDQPIKLFACNTGKGTQSFAQNLANKLGVPVQAPTSYLWARPDGSYFVADKLATSMNPDLSKVGTFKTYYPGGDRRK